jgi:cell division protein ZapA
MKQLEVQIMGQSYLLGCPDGGDASLLKAVERVDAAMCKIRDAGKVRARDRIAVLAALNLAFDLADQDVPSVKTVAAPLPDAHGTPAELALSTPLELNNPIYSALLHRLDVALGDSIDK